MAGVEEASDLAVKPKQNNRAKPETEAETDKTTQNRKQTRKKNTAAVAVELNTENNTEKSCGKSKPKSTKSKLKSSEPEASKSEDSIVIRKKCTNSRDRNFVGRSSRTMFSMDFEERHDLEQYFWTEKTIQSLMSAISSTYAYDPEEDCCCLCTPSLAHNWWAGESKDVSLLDIDTRFKYLPKFRYFDLRRPNLSAGSKTEPGAEPVTEPERAPSDSGVESDSNSENPEPSSSSSRTSNAESESDADSASASAGESNSNWRLIIFDPPFFYIPMKVLHEAVVYICGENVKSTKILLGFLKREENILLETFSDFNLKRTNFQLEYAHVKSNKWANYALYSNVDLPGIKRISSSASK